MKTIYKITVLACITVMAAAPVTAQDAVLKLAGGDCLIPIDSNASIPVTILPNGNVEIRVDETVAAPSCFGSGPALDVILTVNPISIDSGDSVNVTWSVVGYDAGTTDCTATGPTAFVSAFNSSPANNPNSPSVETYSLTTDTTFRISCSNAGDTEQTLVDVAGGPSTGPDGFPPPPASCQQDLTNRQISFDIQRNAAANPPDGQSKVNFEGAWTIWPGTGETHVFIPKGKFLSLPFVAEDIGQFWNILWVDGPTNGIGTVVTISSCPGDFDVATLNPRSCAVQSGANGAKMFARVGSFTGSCDLVDGEIYYLNIEHANYNLSGVRTEGCDTGSLCDFLATVSRN